MTAVLGRPDDPGPPAGSADDAADRGRLDISQRAVERIAAAAAAEVEATGSPVTRVLGQAVGGADLSDRPRAKATVAGDLVTLELSLSVPWPTPVVEVADAVRHRVSEQLGSLAGMRLGHVDVFVTALPASRPRRHLS